MTWFVMLWSGNDHRDGRFLVYHFFDSATNFQIAIPFHHGSLENLFACFQEAWTIGFAEQDPRKQRCMAVAERLPAPCLVIFRKNIVYTHIHFHPEPSGN